MNKYIKYMLLAGAPVLALASCSENSWNEHNLDGFKDEVNYDKAVSGSYTLTADDYKAISQLMVAKATTDAEKAEAKAIEKNCFFNKYGAFPADVALPYFFETSSFPYYLASNGSSADVAYSEASEVPAELSALAGALKYEVTADDYIAAWGNDENYINAFAPMTSAANKLPGILKSALADATEGTYAVVTYANASTNPVFGAMETSKFEAGAYYMVADGKFAAVPLPNKTYGYLGQAEVTIDGDKVNTDATNIFTFEETAGGFYIKDSNDRYVYQTGNYNSFNFSANLPNDGAVWTVEINGNGLATITNTSVNKWIQYSSSYTSWGSYNYEAGSLPKLYKAATKATRAAVSTPPAETVNAVYYYNGTRWSLADGVSVLNPADYEAMGASDNNLSDPEIYIPLYLKNKFIYAQAGDERFVAYNGDKADLFVFDGNKWNLNNNGLEAVVGRFTKKNDAWSFTKYIGKATFSLFEEDQIMLNRTYLLVYGSICATPLEKSLNYGYLPAGGVAISGTSIVLPSDANAFRFATKVKVADVEYTCPAGKFLIIDSNDRINYYDGSHASMQVKNAPAIVDGQIDPIYLWTATADENGTWKIESKHSDDNVRWLVYSSKYNNFAIYNTITETDNYPVLYVMDE